jgi:hypothetical protein
LAARRARTANDAGNRISWQPVTGYGGKELAEGDELDSNSLRVRQRSVTQPSEKCPEIVSPPAGRRAVREPRPAQKWAPSPSEELQPPNSPSRPEGNPWGRFLTCPPCGNSRHLLALRPLQALRRALRSAKPDDEGFPRVGGPGVLDTAIGPPNRGPVDPRVNAPFAVGDGPPAIQAYRRSSVNDTRSALCNREFHVLWR